ncbi:aromatic ring-hydroxylating dioxygenase subunit alpha [Ramlibacter sp. AW1]|uniref:Aromatic ring-hydroxylating dioxygenase subunit alpha n=1 Tax=Ramlibacter aurantiacus TaxID=2801330 RepID=A0A936ZQD7_9BURK|nr:aromatic ring-hydroxylating dioxygenase subunit alpha [Ramlibacter aurantiacus]MBL0420581.1 aromatic ring-hydroxylating dioxygenase subunit alpha [Ramlibacter aurantiacus]
MFVRDLWYPVMWSEELKPGQLLARRVLDEPLVFFRSPQGDAAALFDMCPHRQVPLHLGRVLPGGQLQCGYHGLEFAADGRCTRNPHGGPIASGLKVRSYPVLEKHTLVWAWMGDAPPDAASIPDFGLMDERPDGLMRGRSYLHIAANYLLVADNLLDLSHANYLHEGILGLPEHSAAQVSVEQVGDTVTCQRFMPGVPIARMHDLMYRQDGQPIDMWNRVRWDPPGCLILTHGFARPGGADPFEFSAVHLLTPESEASTHYSYGIVRTPATQDDDTVAAEVAATRKFVFEQQDRLVLEAQQRMHQAYPQAAAAPVLLSIDAASVRMRRILQRKLEAIRV